MVYLFGCWFECVVGGIVCLDDDGFGGVVVVDCGSYL